MDPLTIMSLGSAVLGGTQSILGAFGGNPENEAAIERYNQQLKIANLKNVQGVANYATRVADADTNIKAADRAASRAYGAIDLAQSEQLKKASTDIVNLQMAALKSGGAAAAAGKTGRTAETQDFFRGESAVSKGKAMIASNLLSAASAADMRRTGIAGQTQDQISRITRSVGPKPLEVTVPEPTLAETSSLQQALQVGQGLLQIGSGAAGAFAPNPGDLSGYGSDILPEGSGFGSNFGELDLGITPITSGINYFGN